MSATVKFTPINWGEVRSSGAGLQTRKFWDTQKSRWW